MYRSHCSRTPLRVCTARVAKCIQHAWVSGRTLQLINAAICFLQSSIRGYYSPPEFSNNHMLDHMLPIAYGIFSVVVLALGFMAGYFVAGQQVNMLTQQLEKQKQQSVRRKVKLEECRTVTATLSQQGNTLKAMASTHEPTISQPVMQAIEQMSTTTRSLSQKIAEMGEENAIKAKPPPTAKPNSNTATSTANQPIVAETASVRPATAENPNQQPQVPPASRTRQLKILVPTIVQREKDGLTEAEISGLTESQTFDADQIQRSELRRRYVCEQFMAPWSEEDGFLDNLEFTPVRCHDISSAGISFVVPELPASDTLVISIGPHSAPILMAVRVAHSRSVYMYNQIGYLVGCQFVKRIGNLAPIVTAELSNAAGPA